MQVQRYPNGDLLVPARAEGPGGLTGDGARRLPKGSAEWQRWQDWLSRSGEPVTELTDRS
jgi:hypothetical protein